MDALASQLDSSSEYSSDDASTHPLNNATHPTTKSNDLPIIGTGKVHTVKIDPDVTVNNRAIRISAAYRLLTHYKYPSTIFTSHSTTSSSGLSSFYPTTSATSSQEQETMTWRCPSNLRAFDLLLTTSNKDPIARFTANYLSLTNVGAIELYTPLAANNIEALNEIIVTGWTLYQTMLWRSSNPVPLIGAVIARTGREKNVPLYEGGNGNGQKEIGGRDGRSYLGDGVYEMEDKKVR